jgi:hypothetical protein
MSRILVYTRGVENADSSLLVDKLKAIYIYETDKNPPYLHILDYS